MKQLIDLKKPAPRMLADADVQAILAAVEREMGEPRGNAPGHGHDAPGIWDEDNGELAGKPCAWCLCWKAFTGLITTEARAAEALLDSRDAD